MNAIFDVRRNCVPSRIQKLCPVCSEPLRCASDDRIDGESTVRDRHFVCYHSACYKSAVVPKTWSRWNNMVTREDILEKKSREIQDLYKSYREAAVSLRTVLAQRESLEAEMEAKVRGEVVRQISQLSLWQRLRVLFGCSGDNTLATALAKMKKERTRDE